MQQAQPVHEHELIEFQRREAPLRVPVFNWFITWRYCRADLSSWPRRTLFLKNLCEDAEQTRLFPFSSHEVTTSFVACISCSCVSSLETCTLFTFVCKLTSLLFRDDIGLGTISHAWYMWEIWWVWHGILVKRRKRDGEDDEIEQSFRQAKP